MKKDSHWIKLAVGIAILLIVAYFMDVFDGLTTNTVIQALMRALRCVIHISLLIKWCASLQRRIIPCVKGKFMAGKI